jgi:hypothetical protein
MVNLFFILIKEIRKNIFQEKVTSPINSTYNISNKQTMMKEYGTDLEAALINIENKINRRAKLINEEMFNGYFDLLDLDIYEKLYMIKEGERLYRERSQQTNMFDENPQG